MGRAWNTESSSGQFDWVSWDRTYNSAHLQLSVRSSGTNYVGNWITLPSGAAATGITNYDLRDNSVWGKALQWKTDLFRGGTENNPNLHSISVSFGSGTTQQRLGERGGAWTTIYTSSL